MSLPLTLIPKTPRMQARIVRFIDALKQVRAVFDESKDISFADFHSQMEVSHIDLPCEADPELGIKMMTTSCWQKMPELADENRIFNILTIETSKGAFSFRASDKDVPITGTSPLDIVRHIADYYRPLPSRAFHILNEEYEGTGDWVASHPFLQILRSAYKYHKPFAQRMADEAIVSLGIPTRDTYQWYFDINPDHRGMIAQTALGTPVAAPDLHPDFVRQIGNYAIIESYGQKHAECITPSFIITGRPLEISPLDSMKHISLLRDFANSVSPPPPTPIR